MEESNLFSHQRTAIELILKHRQVILAHDVGLGKSATALISAKHSGVKDIAIFCPAYLIFNWKNEIEKWTPELRNSVTIKSYSNLKGEAPAAQFVIFDECQYLKNHRAKRTSTLHEYVKWLKPKYLVLLSGTPVKNRVPEFHSLLKLISYTDAPNGLKMDMSYYKFCDTFSNKIEKRFNGATVYVYEGMKNIDQLREYLKGKYQRVELKDAIDLPELMMKKVLIPPVDNVELKEAWDAYNDKKSAEYFSTVKKNNAFHKAEFTANYVKELIDNGVGPIVVFTDHVDSLKLMGGMLKCPTISGGTSVENRAVYFTLFQAGQINVLCGTIGAMSTGVTLTKSSNMVFCDYPWVPADLKQAEGRIHRIGQKEKCVAHYILAGKIDEYILDTLRKKNEIIRELEKNPH